MQEITRHLGTSLPFTLFLGLLGVATPLFAGPDPGTPTPSATATSAATATATPTSTPTGA
jgi:hypothetical protein